MSPGEPLCRLYEGANDETYLLRNGGDSVRVPASDPCRRSRTSWRPCAAEIAKQQVVIAQLLKRIEALEKQPAPAAASLQELQDDIKAQEDSVNSLRETINSKVNLNGYYNFRFFADGSEEPMAFQQHHLGVLMAKQLGKFNFLMELELQNVPHHPEIVTERKRTRKSTRKAKKHAETDISGEGQVAVENAWMEYNHNRLLSVRGRQAAVAAILVAEPLSEPDAVDRASHLSPRAVPGGTGRRDGAGIGGQAGRHVRVRRRLQVLRRQQQLRRQQPHRSPRRQIVGRARAGSLPDRRARCGASTWRSISIAAMWG